MVNVLGGRKRKIKNYLSRQNWILMELQQALSVASNNSNGGVRPPHRVPANQTAQRPIILIKIKQVVQEVNPGTNKNTNDPFKTYLMRFMREINNCMDPNAKEFHTQMNQNPGEDLVITSLLIW